MTIRVEVTNRKKERITSVSQHILQNASTLGIHGLTACRISQLYFLQQDLDQRNGSAESLSRLCASLLVDPVTEQANWYELTDQTSNHEHIDQQKQVVEVAPRPGVTDVTARELIRGMVELGLPTTAVTTATRYELEGDLEEADLQLLAQKLLCNETVEYYSLGPITPQFGQDMAPSRHVEVVPLCDLEDAALSKLSQQRLLSLDLDEMKTIQEFYRQAEREPTDAELETLAQTWSEHCVHKTFRARITFTRRDPEGNTLGVQEIDGLLNQYIRAATEKIDPAWLYSAFVDDAGIIAFDDNNDLAFKAETHNHPSALEPFGGANTGIGGVVRDILGVSARPIATTNVLCFGPQDYAHENLPEGMLHPQRIAQGVVAGVGDYGNKLGLPTANGAVIYDPGYLGNPLVFCGCVGLLPHDSHPTVAQPNDLVVVLGGRTGRDGLHGATFSSAELTHDTAETTGSAVQIGDPITEKGLIELIQVARDEQLYSAITDCGAGGLSSAVGEMGETLGVDVDLSKVVLKYPGLVPWEIWLSEAQERMVIAVPPDKLDRLHTLADKWQVEVTVLGHFTGNGLLHVHYAGQQVAHLPMQFLHDGLPRREMSAAWQAPAIPDEPSPQPANLTSILLTLLAHPSIASKEAIVRTYDHEVRGGTIVRPFTGPEMDGPADAAMLKPLGTWQHDRAFTLSVGINPMLGKCDPYAMAVSAIDEAFRNAVAVGADPDRMALLDNFCWGNPTYSDRLGALVRACQGCYDGAVAYGAPFISGKDSLYNEFNGNPIPSTLLISAIGIAPDMTKRTTSDLKSADNLLYLLGETHAELGGSHLYDQLGYAGGTAPKMPDEPLTRYRLLHQAMLKGWVQSCHDLSEGGLAVALAEMALAGRLGAEIELPIDPALTIIDQLFSESNGRLVVEVRPEDRENIEIHFADVAFARIGCVMEKQNLTVCQNESALVDVCHDQMIAAWKHQEITL